VSKYIALDERLYRYLVAHRTPDDPLFDELREETARLGSPAVMQISPDQGRLLTLLVAATGTRRALEIGTFTGMSALCIARGLPPDGELLACDRSGEWTAIARRYWERAGLADRIRLVLAPAAQTLAALPAEPSFEFAFLDADKTGYLGYYEQILPRLRPNGLIVVDNVLWSGRVVKDRRPDEDTRALRAFNDAVLADSRVESVMIPVADGLTLIRKRASGC
jgi:caffeoyl-CoA O-methyltransferase